MQPSFPFEHDVSHWNKDFSVRMHTQNRMTIYPYMDRRCHILLPVDDCAAQCSMEPEGITLDTCELVDDLSCELGSQYKISM
jgi:hypothetical protein